ncbi:hypothetical protein TEA_027191 [Camellia sinensis var. sinensis]|uniref:Uncharacterized protein n=1 Tax=Camellia sinensis var. sinensis TaxID=542762 RepID=A0A4S4E7R1_CAMSN|nr:hypothetical protein TEA_027191 [Camellia sinensis var. sinensis]
MDSMPKQKEFTLNKGKMSKEAHRSRYISKCTSKVMGLDNFPLISQKTHANFRLCNVSSYTTNLLEIRAEDPSLHVLFIPGNPGVISFYTDFLENLYELLGGTASITGMTWFYLVHVLEFSQL